MVIWLIGLSGAGKSTLGQALAAQWRTRCAGTVLVDGDVVRRLFRHQDGDLPYTVQGRRENAERMAGLCQWLDEQQLNVVCCILSIFPDMRAANRQRFSRYFEVYLDAPLEVLIRRDRKDLYRPALRGERRHVVGVDLAFEPPASPDLTIDTSGSLPDIEALARSVLKQADAW